MIIREYYQKDAPDPILDADYVLSLVHRHVPSAEAVTGIDESGGEARVYFVDQAVVLKVQRPQQLRSWTSLEKEVVFLRHLALHAPRLPVPRVLGYGRDGTVEYTCMTRVPGDAAVRTPIPDAVREATLRDLGRAIRSVHSIPDAPLRSSGLFPEEFTPDDLRAALARDLTSYASHLAQRGVAWPLPLSLEELTEAAQRQVPEVPLAVALHTNPGPTHTFVSPATGAFTGLIDFGDAYIGHPAYDLGRWPLPGDRAAVLAGYIEEGDPGPAFWAFWSVANVLADMLVMARNASPSGQVLREQAVANIVGRVERWRSGDGRA